MPSYLNFPIQFDTNFLDTSLFFEWYRPFRMYGYNFVSISNLFSRVLHVPSLSTNLIR